MPSLGPTSELRCSTIRCVCCAVRGSANKSAASAASLDYIKFQAVIKSAAGAASLRGGRASGRLDHGFFLRFLDALAAKKLAHDQRKIAFWGLLYRACTSRPPIKEFAVNHLKPKMVEMLELSSIQLPEGGLEQ